MVRFWVVVALAGSGCGDSSSSPAIDATDSGKRTPT
jgi:hypothetical protein